jgi:DNA-directed RNA polymerase subunit RPC12/RpoP
MAISDKGKCSICSCDFSTEEECGMNGHIGILPVSLCQLCYNGMVEMVELLEPNANIECPECGHEIKLKVEIA